ncbi:deazapurine DNA modification protein DpdA family protein [Azospirillum aestuarii]|uniref:deazapurine DNA modification protein DpdA family protein n=1 Tax=Azospirillum aestuarii TaxID=2802052 RepID=UPI00405506CA
MRFFVGLHQPSDAAKVEAPAFISVNRLKKRKSGFDVGDWIMDSGAFSTILTHGGYPEEPEAYAAEIRRWAGNGNLLAAVAQDYMCEARMLAITGMTIEEHQRLTIWRYDLLTACDTGGVYIMPVLQGYAPEDYVRHIRMYGDRLQPGMWVGVGSVCKRNGNPAAIEDVLLAIKRERPDLLLHGFGLKTTALGSGLVRDLLYTADSMAWSFAARKQGRNANDWREAVAFADRIECMSFQHALHLSTPLPESEA